MPVRVEDKPIAELEIDDLSGIVTDLKDDGIDSSLLYFEGDHWQGGVEWKGPPDLDVATRPRDLLEKIYPVFVSKNIIREVVVRHRNAVTGKEPDWSLTVTRPLAEDEELTADEQALIDEAEATLTDWWDNQCLLEVIQDATDTLLLAGRAIIRLYIPRGLLTEDGMAVRADFTVWLTRIYAMVPEYKQATLIIEDATERRAGVFSYLQENETTVELDFVNDSGQSIIRILSQESKTDSQPINLGGRIRMVELRREPLITEQIRQNQASYNVTRTMRMRNIGVAGFPTETYLNAAAPTERQADPNNPGLYINVAVPHKRGPGITNYVAGVVDKDGKISTPAISYRDPVNVDTFDKTEESTYVSILEEVDQLHALNARDGSISGESRIQARSSFVASLRKTKTQVDRAGREIIETTLAMAAALSGQPGRFDSLRAVFECRLDPGPLTSEERKVIVQEVKDGIRSRADAMTLLGVEDPDAMIAEILAEREMFTPAELTGETEDEDETDSDSSDEDNTDEE